MNKTLLVTFLALIFTNLFSNDLPKIEEIQNTETFGIEETVKGYLNLYLINKDGSKLNLLDNGMYRNSRIFIKDSDKRFYLREHGQYAISIIDDSLFIKWRVETLEIIEEYKKSENGFIYNIDIKNRTENDRNIGLYLMYDTYLGEDNGDHFVIDNNKIFKKEKRFTSSEIPHSVKSINVRGQGIEFRVMENNSFKPEYLILGNWDRLAYSKKWPYKPTDGGFFSYGYYSINDSGVGIFYPGVNVLSNENISYSLEINVIDEKVIDIDLQNEIKPENPKKWSIEKESSLESDKSVEPIKSIDDSLKVDDNIDVKTSDSADVIVSEENIKIESVLSPDEKGVLTEKEELKQMLEYIQKKKRGEDVSEYGFDEEYIMMKLKEINE